MLAGLIDLENTCETEGESAGNTPTRPELLAPAGDRECLKAAIENGADAVYFGLERHNARIRATNFGGAELPEIMAELHRRGVKGYVALNTLIFTHELGEIETAVREIALAGVDAVIVQDLGLVGLIRAIAPDLEIHASTQMSITSAAGVTLAAEMGCSRVILARELSLAEIGKIRRDSPIPLEVFVHGALCVAYSGQCLTSEALGGRSANRGECAQACRMPYTVVRDGKDIELGDLQYLLSPQDLAAYDLVPRLIELGVSSLKIEGRLKTAEYVANITRHYRDALDAAWAGKPATFTKSQVDEMQLSFSRGFSHGFLDGINHKVLVRGDYSKKRGLPLGSIEAITGSGVHLTLASPVKPGDGLVFDGDDSSGLAEQGGRVYEVVDRPAFPRVELRFGRGDVDLRALQVGQRVWKTDDPELSRRLRKSFEGRPTRLIVVDFAVTAQVGTPLAITATTATGRTAFAQTTEVLSMADSLVADEALFRDQLGRLGGTIYALGSVTARIEGRPLAPKSLINHLRRELIEQLDQESTADRVIVRQPVLPRLMTPIVAERAAEISRPVPTAAEITVLCRRLDQIAPALESGVRTLYVDLQDVKECARAVAITRDRGPLATLHLATPRIEKPGEANLFAYLARQGADGLLVRNAGGMAYCIERGVPFVADFALNAANPLTVAFLKGRGAAWATASYDLSAAQLFDLFAEVPPSWLEVVVHQHIPMFHMEHCVFCAVLSPGTDATNCGRPCDRHQVSLRDRVGKVHPLKADVGCRNTLYNATPQTAAEFLPALLARGARRLRVEFLDDEPADVASILELYHATLAGRRDARSLWRELRATGQYGVTRGPLTVLG